MRQARSDKRKGQSLIEILVAATLAVIFLGAAMSAIVPSLKATTDSGTLYTAASLGRGLLAAVGAFAESDWNGAVGTAVPGEHYHVQASVPPVRADGDDTVTVAGKQYTIYYTVSDVYRDIAGAIADAGTTDLSTRKVTVFFGLQGKALQSTGAYLVRFRNRTLVQTDWSGGSGVVGPVTNLGNQYDTASSTVNVSTTTGSILLDLQ